MNYGHLALEKQINTSWKIFISFSFSFITYSKFLSSKSFVFHLRPARVTSLQGFLSPEQ